MNTNNNHKFRNKSAGDIQAVIMIIIFVLGVFSWVGLRFVKGNKSSRGFGFALPQSQQKLCYANMRVILGACEMYNMDHDKMIHKLKEKDYSSKSGRLVKNKYLLKPLSMPSSKCRYFSIGDLAESGTICCKKHGTVENESQLRMMKKGY